MTDLVRPYDFTSGRQPCERFDPRVEHLGTNVHECFGPYDPALRAGGARCQGLVSFCENCSSDHHEGGWNACPSPELDRRPPSGRLD